MFNKDKRALLFEAVFACGLIAIGIPTGQVPLVALAASVVGVGSNWAYSLADRGFQHWCDGWFTDEGVLNNDIQKALCKAFVEAIKQLEHNWKPHYEWLRSKGKTEEAESTLYALRELRKEGSHLLLRPNRQIQGNQQQQPTQQQSTQQSLLKQIEEDQVLSFLYQKDEFKASEALKSALRDFLLSDDHLYTQNNVFVTFVTEQLGPKWILRFVEILKDPRKGTPAWRACQLLWQKSLMSSVGEIKGTTDEMAVAVRWLQEWGLQLESLPLTQRDTTGQEALEQILHSVQTQLDKVLAGLGELQATANRTEKNTEPIADIDKKTDLIPDMKTMLEEIRQKAIPLNLVSPSIRPKVPHNLPSRGEFIGREKEMKEVLEVLSSHRYPLLSIEGMGGVGKTVLAIEVAYYCLPGDDTKLDSPFEAIAWISASDQPNQWFNEVLNTIAGVLGYLSITQMSQEQKILEIDQLLRTYRTLIIVDNFEYIEDLELVRWIQRQVPEPSKAIIIHRYNKIRKTYDIQLEGLEVSEALELIHNHIQQFKWQSVEHAKEEKWRSLVRATGGNPRAIEMALGYMKRGKLSLDEVVQHLYTASQSVDDLFDDLYTRFWEKLLSQDAKQILLALPFFVDVVSKEALGATSGLMGHHLDYALEELVELALLKVHEEHVITSLHYGTHPLTRAFAKAKLLKMPEFEEQARLRWCSYYLDFVRRCLVRERPKEYYWNTIDSSGFKLVDPEWDNIRQVLIWVDTQEQHQILLDLVLLLAHYMDRRFQNIERVDYVQKAAEAASKLGRKEEEAHLRIDALGWTFIDQSRFEEAMQEITNGLQIVESLHNESECKRDLAILAKAFLARIFLQQGDVQKALELINEVNLTHCMPIIKSRVYMIAGDIACRENENAEAIRIYKELILCTQEYGGEGTGSEQYFRLGLAYLANGDLAEAEAAFHEVLAGAGVYGITIEILYVKYGLAAVAKARGEKDEAIRLAQETREEISRLLKAHYLLDQVDDLLQELKAM